MDLAVRPFHFTSGFALLPVSVDRGIHASPRFTLGPVEDGHTRIGDRISVVIAIDRAHVGLAPLEIELLDLEERSFDDVNRLRMKRRGAAREVGFSDDTRLTCR